MSGVVPIALATVFPAGSGNGFARDLGIPLRPDEALRAAVTGDTRRVDVGLANGRSFVATAGIGFDAHVTHVFAARSARRRGAAGYVLAGLREARRFRPVDGSVLLDGVEAARGPFLLEAVANTRQWGNDALIAPAEHFAWRPLRRAIYSRPTLPVLFTTTSMVTERAVKANADLPTGPCIWT